MILIIYNNYWLSPYFDVQIQYINIADSIQNISVSLICPFPSFAIPYLDFFEFRSAFYVLFSICAFSYYTSASICLSYTDEDTLIFLLSVYPVLLGESFSKLCSSIRQFRNHSVF